VRPYGFFTRRGIWYLVGGDVEDDQTKVFRVSRIDADKKVRSFPQETFEVPATFRLRDYSEVPPWRFQPENPVEQVSVEIDRQEFWRVEESCRRDGQVEKTPSGFLWRVGVHSYTPLINWLLPLGASVQPVSPPPFVECYRETIETILAQYEVVE
jgi:predicted DNA-binding transcriptional regulator YafY